MAALVVACGGALLAHRCLRERANFRGLLVRLLPLVVLGVAPLLVWCAILWSRGGLGFFFDTYFGALFSQVTSRYPSTLLERFVALPEWIFERAPVRAFVPMTMLFAVSGTIALFFVRRPKRAALEIGMAALYLVISIYAVIQPGGRFPHYMNLLLQPYALLSCWSSPPGAGGAPTLVARPISYSRWCSRRSGGFRVSPSPRLPCAGKP